MTEDDFRQLKEVFMGAVSKLDCFPCIVKPVNIPCLVGNYNMS